MELYENNTTSQKANIININTGSRQRPISPGGGGEGIPYNDIPGESKSRKEYFLSLQVYERKGWDFTC